MNDNVLLATIKKLGTDDSGFIDDVRRFAEESKITTNQLRNFYDMIVSSNPDDDNIDDLRKKLVKMRIMIEYAMNRKNIPYPFYVSMKPLIEELIKRPDKDMIKKFKQLMEAIVAFSKKEGR